MVSLLLILPSKQSNLSWRGGGEIYRTCGNDDRPGRQILPKTKVELVSVKAERQIPIDRDIIHFTRLPRVAAKIVSSHTRGYTSCLRL